MPYMMVETDGEYSVYKQGTDRKPAGKALNKKAMTKAQASKYMAALYANTDGGKKDLNEDELVSLEDKCYNDYSSNKKIDQTDPRAMYDPMAGRIGEQACANCYWFNPGSSSCDVVYGQIVATGKSKLWMAQKSLETIDPSPVPVYIVEPDEKSAHSVEVKASWIDRIITTFSGKGNQPAMLDDTEMNFKLLDNGRWVGWWTNNAKDKAKENFTAKSIDAYIARVKGGIVPYPELWFKHYPIRMGKADLLTRIGYLTLASGTFYDTHEGQIGKAYYAAEQKAGRSKTMSHGYLYPNNLKVKGIYHAFNTFEISPLDPGEEANPITNFEVKAMFAKLDQKGLAELQKVFGEEYAKKLVNFGETKSKELEATGIDLKSFNTFDDIALQDKTAHDGIKALAEATVEGLKRIGTRLDEVIESVKGAQETADKSVQAVTDLKAFVEEELNYTPRASKAEETKRPATDPQVTHLKTENKKAGQKKAQSTPAVDKKGIFDAIYEAAGIEVAE